MAKDEKREEAKRLFIRESKDIKEIAHILSVNEVTIYRWKKEDEEENKNWDEQKNLWNLSPSELEKIYLESVKELVLKVKEDPDLMLDSKIADAMSKHISNLKKMNPRQLYLGISIDLITVIDNYLKKTDKKLWNEFFNHLDGIKEEFRYYIENRL
ncbi:MAG: DUF1804 family protein [Spirochaetes bacterium]|nr:DUF1804 family protein [Spirochaetota bacterium]